MQIKSQEWPVFEKNGFFHVGNLNSDDKGSLHQKSLEGNGLSISLNPEEWRAIAKLGDAPVWHIESPKDKSIRLIDAHLLTEEHKQLVHEWGTQNGYSQKTQATKISWDDEEIPGRSYILIDHSARKEGQQSVADEINWYLEEYEESDVKAEESWMNQATAKFSRRQGFEVDVSIFEDLLLASYVEDELSKYGISGVWWSDELDVHNYSAPRGVISRREVGTFFKSQVLPEVPMDDYIDHDQDHRQALEESGFWGRQGAGCIILARDTGRILVGQRSEGVLEPGTWGTWGGAIDPGENPAEGMLRETQEEVGEIEFKSTIKLTEFKSPNGFVYHNFLGIVQGEFDPDLNWENDGFAWIEPSELLENNSQRPYHPGLTYLLSEDGGKIFSIAKAEYASSVSEEASLRKKQNSKLG